MINVLKSDILDRASILALAQLDPMWRGYLDSLVCHIIYRMEYLRGIFF